MSDLISVFTSKQWATARIEGIQTLRDNLDALELSDYIVSKLLEAGIPIAFRYASNGNKVFEGITYGAMKCVNGTDSRDFIWTADAAALGFQANSEQ